MFMFCHCICLVIHFEISKNGLALFSKKYGNIPTCKVKQGKVQTVPPTPLGGELVTSLSSFSAHDGWNLNVASEDATTSPHPQVEGGPLVFWSELARSDLDLFCCIDIQSYSCILHSGY